MQFDHVSVLGPTAIAIVIGVVAYMRRQQLGLGDSQLATNEERDRLLSMQSERIALLETRLDELTAELVHIRAENKHLRSRLEEVR